MPRLSTPACPQPVVLLVQPAHDDGLEMYTEFLRSRGLTVMPVSTIRDAFKAAPRADIVVTGMNVSSPMDGVALVSRLRRSQRTRLTPIIVLTASVWVFDRTRAESVGCDVFLSKPCLPTDLLGHVRQLLATRSHKARWEAARRLACI
jgi:CheY-like chemotaxis protein